MKKNRVYEILEGGGLIYKGESKQEAFDAMVTYLDKAVKCYDENMDMPPYTSMRREISLEKVVPERLYHHRKCRQSSVGDNICIECGEHLNGKGVDVFVYYHF